MEYVTDIFDIPICTKASGAAKQGGARGFLPDEGTPAPSGAQSPDWGCGELPEAPGFCASTLSQAGKDLSSKGAEVEQLGPGDHGNSRALREE